MANFIFNSARQLFAEGKIDWTYLNGTSTNRALTGVTVAPFDDYKIKAAMVNTVSGSGGTPIAVYNPTGYDTSTITFVNNVSGNMKSIFNYDAAAPACTASPLIRSGAGVLIEAELTGRSIVSGSAACDADDITFSAVATTFNGGTSTFGPIEGLVIYLEPFAGTTNSGGDCPVIAFIDTLSGPVGMSITPNGGDIVVQWSASGIFRL